MVNGSQTLISGGEIKVPGRFKTRFVSELGWNDPSSSNASDLLSLETRLQGWISERFPLLKPEISIDYESTRESKYVVVNLGKTVSSSEWAQIQQGIESIQVDTSSILIYSVIQDREYPHEWLYGIIDYLQAQLQIDAIYVLELYQKMGIDLNLESSADPETSLGSETQDQVSVISDGESLTLRLSTALQSEHFDINSYTDALISRLTQRISGLWRTGVVRIPPSRKSLIDLWSLTPVESPLISFTVTDLYQPPVTLQNPVPLLLSLIRHYAWIPLFYNLNPVQRHFIAEQLQVVFEFRSPIGPSVVWVQIPVDHEGWEWILKVKSQIESALAKTSGTVEVFSYATEEMALEAAGETGLVYQIWSLDLPFMVSYLNTSGTVAIDRNCGQSPILFGMTITSDNINQTTDIITSIQSQIKFLLYTYFGVIPTSISTRKRFTDIPITVFIPLQNGQRILVSRRIWSEIYWDFDPKRTVVGYGPYGHRVAQILADPRLEIYPDRVQCLTEYHQLVTKFQTLFQTLMGSAITTVNTGFDGISILNELAPRFQFELMCKSQLYSLIAPAHSQIQDLWCKSATERIRKNQLPLWRVSGPWFNDNDLSQVVLEGASLFAFARTVIRYPELNNFADQIHVCADGSVEVPVFNSDQGMIFRQELSDLLKNELQVKLAESWEEALQIRLSGPGRLIIPLRSDFYVVSLNPFGPPREKSELINSLLEQVSVCREGMDPVQSKKFSELGLSQLMTVIALDGPDPWCLMADSVQYEGVEEYTSMEFLTQVDLNQLTVRGVYSGIVPGLLPILHEEVYPTTGKIRLDSSDREDFLDVVAILETPDREFPIYQFLFERDQVHLEGIEQILNLAWKQGLLWNSWGKHLYKTTGHISRTPVVSPPAEVRDSPELGIQFLEVLDRLL